MIITVVKYYWKTAYNFVRISRKGFAKKVNNPYSAILFLPTDAGSFYLEKRLHPRSDPIGFQFRIPRLPYRMAMDSF